MALGAALLLPAGTAFSRDTQLFLPIEAAMTTPAAQEKLDSSIKFYFGDQPHPATGNRTVEMITHKKTNAFNKTDEKACQWAFLSAMIALQERARSEGADAVVGITSYYKRNEYSSRENFECQAGGLMAGVELKGKIVKLK
ncbi:excinuclease ATPase subunit [Pseudomaricurvus sp. HS19]|nr:excinuclease ATPase subunit [Pseudomaricurvus sp. HS19]